MITSFSITIRHHLLLPRLLDEFEVFSGGQAQVASFHLRLAKSRIPEQGGSSLTAFLKVNVTNVGWPCAIGDVANIETYSNDQKKIWAEYFLGVAGIFFV